MARHALVIGIAQYDPPFRNLPGAAEDAAAIASLLQKNGYTITPLPCKFVGENQTQQAIAPKKRLTATELGSKLSHFLAEQARGHDIVIYFAGHGFRAKDTTGGEIGYLAASDSKKDGTNAIRFEDFNRLISKAEPASLVILMDCCYAGGLTDPKSFLEPTRTTIDQKDRSYLIAACQAFERAREVEKRGIFTAAVLQGLSKENARHGKITCAGLYDFVNNALDQSGQEAVAAGRGNNISLVTYVVDEPEQQEKSVLANPLELAVELLQDDFELLDQHFFERLQRNPGRSHILKLPAATWSLVLQGNYVERDQQWEALELAQQLIQIQGTSLLLIRGEPGAGKTALMRWLAYSLFLDGCLILHKKSQDSLGWLSQLQEFTEAIGEQRVYVITDDLFRDDALLTELEQNEFLPNLTIIGTTRLNESRHERLEELEYEVRCLDLNRPSEAEKHRVLEKVCQDEQVLARVERLSTVERQKLMDSPIMLVLMLQLAEGKPFNRIIADIIKQLPSSEHRPTYQVFGVICSFFQYGCIVPPEIIELCVPRFKQARRLVMTDLKGLTDTDIKAGYEGLSTIHELIAQTAMEVNERPNHDQENLLYSWIDSPSLLEQNLRAAVSQINVETEIHKRWTYWVLTNLVRIGQTKLIRRILADYSDRISKLKKASGIFGLWRFVEIYQAVGLSDESSRCTELILETEPRDSGERILWLSKVDKYGTAEQRQEAIAQTQAWLESNLDDYCVWEKYLALIGTYGTAEQRQEAIAQTPGWLNSHPDNANVRRKYLALIGIHGTAEQKRTAIAQTQTWLDSHFDDNSVRTKYLALIDNCGTAEQKRAVIAQTQTWLDSHFDDNSVRTKYLALIDNCGTAEQKQKAIAQTQTWLDSHPDDYYLRTKYLALIDNCGIAEQQQKAIAQTQAWLDSHPENIDVRTKYLALIGTCGTAEQKRTVITQTQTWLDSHPDDYYVRTKYLDLAGAYSSIEQKREAINQTQTWLDSHPDDTNVRAQCLVLMGTASLGDESIKEQVIQKQQLWLSERQIVSQNIWEAFLPALYHHSTFESSKEMIERALEQYPENTNIAILVFGYFRDQLDYDLCNRLASLIEKSDLPPIQWNHYIDVANFFRDYGETEKAKQIYKRTLKLARYLSRKNRSFQKEVNYTSISYARLLLLENSPKPDQAIKLIQPILAKISKHAVCHWIMSLCYQSKGRRFYEKAIESFKKAIKFDLKKEGFFWYQFGCFYRDSLNDTAQAKSCFEKSLLQKVTFSACIDLADLEFDDGNLSKAKYYLQKGLKLVPANRIEREEREKLSDHIEFLKEQLGDVK
ncbi:MAG: hypothetical protein F6J87_12885 [Spirulina sp. SIO3F2]|nr:hypothetical protein [Spirulina sp. SIO3F2]